MLKGIPPQLGPDLLWAIAAMGHGDLLAVVDRNYPARSLHSRVIDMGGVTLEQAVAAIATYFPLDVVQQPAIAFMVPDGEPDAEYEIHRRVIAAASAADQSPASNGGIERTRFYQEARTAFAVVLTTDGSSYGCFLLRKGVVS